MTSLQPDCMHPPQTHKRTHKALALANQRNARTANHALQTRQPTNTGSTAAWFAQAANYVIGTATSHHPTFTRPPKCQVSSHGQRQNTRHTYGHLRTTYRLHTTTCELCVHPVSPAPKFAARNKRFASPSQPQLDTNRNRSTHNHLTTAVTPHPNTNKALHREQHCVAANIFTLRPRSPPTQLTETSQANPDMADTAAQQHWRYPCILRTREKLAAATTATGAWKGEARQEAPTPLAQHTVTQFCFCSVVSPAWGGIPDVRL